MNRTTQVMVAGLLMLAGVGIGGCGGKSFKALNMTVGPESATVASRMANIKVDLVGVSDSDADEIKAVNPSDWFASSGPGADKRRKYESATKRVEFKSGQFSQIVLKPGDDAWRTWSGKKATHILVIGDPPPGAPSDRTAWIRDVAPLSRTWESDEIKVWVDNAGLKLDRSPIPEK